MKLILLILFVQLLLCSNGNAFIYIFYVQNKMPLAGNLCSETNIILILFSVIDMQETDWAGLVHLVKFYKSRRFDANIGLPKYDYLQMWLL